MQKNITEISNPLLLTHAYAAAFPPKWWHFLQDDVISLCLSTWIGVTLVQMEEWLCVIHVVELSCLLKITNVIIIIMQTYIHFVRLMLRHDGDMKMYFITVMTVIVCIVVSVFMYWQCEQYNYVNWRARVQRLRWSRKHLLTLTMKNFHHTCVKSHPRVCSTLFMLSEYFLLKY